jgi:hypothetical protein
MSASLHNTGNRRRYKRRIFMKTMRFKTLVHLLLALAIVVLTIGGCGDVSGAPTIPPEETFIIPLDDFPSNETDGLVTLGSGNQSNWLYAAGTVVSWGAILVTTLIVPVATFRASFLHTPVQQDDGSWLWSYSVNVGNATYTAKLHGQFITEGVHWAMNISKEGEYEDFLWYYGEHNLPATEGFWILQKSPADPTDLLQIDWSRNISADTYTIKYTNIVPAGDENGSYIDVQYTKGIPYDYICDLYKKSEGNHTYIDWSSTTKEGRVKDLDRFGDVDWHCWDSDLINVACP